MADQIRIPLATKLGPVTVIPTDADHICVTAESGSPLKVNSVEYRVSFHLFRQVNVSGRASFAPRNYQDLYLRRAVWNGKDDYPSASASKKVTETLTAAVNEWVYAHPAVMEQARVAFLADEITKRNETIAAKRAAIADLEAEIAALVAQRGVHEAVIYEEVK